MDKKGIKIKKLSGSVFLLAAWACLVLSCSESHVEVFEHPASERAAMKVETLRSELIAAKEGWKIAYSPDSAQLGVFTFLMRFNDDGKTVEMVSDFDTSERPPTRSEYNLILGSSVKLSFTTKNEIHKLSDSNNPPTPYFRNRGYGGDFEFIYYGKEKGALLFKGNRSYVKVRFERAKAQDWEYMDESKRMLARMVNAPLDMVTMPGMSVRASATGAEKEYYRKSFMATRLLQWEGINVIEEKAFRILSITPSGFTSSPLVVGYGTNEVQLSEFFYDGTRGVFVAAKDGARAVIWERSRQLPPSNSKFGLGEDSTGFNVFAYFLGDGASDSGQAPETSDEFVALVNRVAARVDDVGEFTLGQFHVQLNRSIKERIRHRIRYILYPQSGQYVRSIDHYFTYELVDDRIRFTPSDWVYDSLLKFGESQKRTHRYALKPLDDFFMSGPLYFRETPRFSIYGYRIFGFKNENTPSLSAGGFYSFN